jgi:transposase
MPYSMDFRQRVIAACDRGMTTSVVARLFLVSPAWVRRLKQRRREDGSIAPRTARPGPARLLGPEHDPLIHTHFQSHPGTTLTQLGEALQAHTGRTYAAMTLWRATRRLGYRFKKSRLSPPSRRVPTSRRSG